MRVFWSTRTGLPIGGHRGASAFAPENTFAAFELAFAAGATFVELDVQVSADGVAMVIHDETLERTTNGRGLVRSRTAAELGRLDAGTWFGPGYAGEGIPTLADFLHWLEPQADRGAILEAKGPGSGERIAGAIRGSPARRRLALCSFSDREIHAARAALPDLFAVRISGLDRPDERDPLEVAVRAGAGGVDVPADLLDPAVVDRLRGAGLFVTGGTALDATTIERCIALGLDAVNANDPSMAVEASTRGRRGAMMPPCD